jgi:hypothetical protein
MPSGKRLAPVPAGRRNAGQRTLELAVWGCDSPEQAAAAMQLQLERIVRVRTLTTLALPAYGLRSSVFGFHFGASASRLPLALCSTVLPTS